MRSLNYRVESPSCLICSSLDLMLVFVAQDLVTRSGKEFRIVECRRCGHMQTNPRPVQDDIGLFYPSNYAPFLLNRVRITFGASKKFSLKNLFAAGFHIPNTSYRGKKVLELGCSTGLFLDSLQKMGADVTGVELSEGAVRVARSRGLNIYNGTIQEIPIENRYDFIFAWMVLEHLFYPKEDLQRINSLLDDEGVLVFSVPNIASLDFKIFRKYWYALQVPTHISHFNKKTIKQILEECGFEIVLMTEPMTSANYIYSLKNICVENNLYRISGLIDVFMGSKWTFLLRKSVDLLVRILGQSGRMIVWARKRPSDA